MNCQDSKPKHKDSPSGKINQRSIINERSGCGQIEPQNLLPEIYSEIINCFLAGLRRDYVRRPETGHENSQNSGSQEGNGHNQEHKLPKVR
jgi:hypothetical protein